MRGLDKQYQQLLQDIIDYGVVKKDRTGTGTKSIFGYTIRHKMSDGFPLLTTKKMPFKTIVTELLWFLRGDTNIKYLVDNGCHIWDGDAYKNYLHKVVRSKDIVRYLKSYSIDTKGVPTIEPYSKEEFIEQIKTDNEFAKQWGDLGPIYGKQWRSWGKHKWDKLDFEFRIEYIDQIQNLINELKTNPDSRRLMVSAWNVGEIDSMVLPPCHYGFQVYTRELSAKERTALGSNGSTRLYDSIKEENYITVDADDVMHTVCDDRGVPRRAISLMWNQRSVDTFLGLPFNIASYGLLLEIIAKAVNMVPDELIGNLGDTHLYSNHIEQAKEQIGRKYTPEERTEMLKEAMGYEAYHKAVDELMPFGGGMSEYYDMHKIPHYTREPYPLPKLNINTEFWPTENGSCGEGPLDAIAIFNGFSNDNFCRCLLEEDIQLGNYQSHPAIKAPLSN